MTHTGFPALVLGLLVTAWMYIMGFTGWYTHPTLNFLFFLVIPIQIGTLVWALRRGPASSYGGQVGRGVVISLLAGLIIIGSSLMFTTVAFPRYSEEMDALHAQLLRNHGTSEAQIAATVANRNAMQTPVGRALAGFIGTLATGLVASLVIAVFARGKRPRAA